MKRRIGGIILLMLGILAFLGSCANGFWEECAYGVGLPEITSIALMIAAVVGGIILIIKEKK